MKRGVAVAVLAPAVAALFVWGGCALVIDLGDEARLRPAETSVEDATPVDDAGPDDASADDGSTGVATCGLPRSPNAACNACIETTCCDISKECAADPDCPARLECIKDCMGNATCVLGCTDGNRTIGDLATCSSLNCAACTPGPECRALGECAAALGDAGDDVLRRAVARGVVLEVDEARCKAERESLAKLQDAAPACFE